MTDDSPRPRWHHDLPTLTGTLKSTPEDFVVEEVPAYEPSGDGEHLFLWIEKRDLSGEQLLKILGRLLEISPHDIGCAGIKDRFAVTRQWISVPAKCEPRLSSVSDDAFRILKAERHGNKLKTGHLRGNRFSILVRSLSSPSPLEGEGGRRPDEGEVTDSVCMLHTSHVDDIPLTPDPSPVRGEGSESLERAEQFVTRLRAKGFPNYYGEQRFGRDGETSTLGFDLIAGRKTPKDIPYSRRKFLLRLSLSAAQSDLFNRVLTARLQDGLLDTVLAGDVMEVAASGGKFIVEDPAAEQPRCDAYETVVTGPMFGPKMKQPAGVPAEREAKVLTDAGLSLDQFRGFGDLLSGTRRPLVIRPGEISVRAEPDGLRFEFTLPSGVYATTLLAEILQ